MGEGGRSEEREKGGRGQKGREERKGTKGGVGRKRDTRVEWKCVGRHREAPVKPASAFLLRHTHPFAFARELGLRREFRQLLCAMSRDAASRAPLQRLRHQELADAGEHMVEHVA